jgi:lycopene cyclase domain-containing protein
MTYWGFLALFLGIPLLLLLALTWWDKHQGRTLPGHLQGAPARWVILAHIVVAVLYTTPWDNYLVATGVWWYDPNLVIGLTIGWVPIEEYTFFVLQTLVMGLWVVWLAKRIGEPIVYPFTLSPLHLVTRKLAAALVGVLWFASAMVLLSGWSPGVYLTLILSWALIPVLIQMALGADILWRYRRLVGWALLPATLYLCVVDTLAIGSGTWTIDPAQTTGLMLGVLPIEEAIFFLMTNVLIVFGMVLVLARESQQRAPAILLKLLPGSQEVVR